MGGRGQASGTYKGLGGSGRPLKFYDKTDRFKGMSLHEFENAIRGRKSEYVGIFNKKGELLIAGTSHNKGSVAIPAGDPRFKGAYTLTHNHPSGDGRGIGGTFSEADVQNNAILGLYQTRAVASGSRENTYIIRKKSGAKTSPSRLLKYANDIESTKAMSKMGNKTLSEVKDRLSKKGIDLDLTTKNKIYLGSMKRTWKNDEVGKAGYEYIEVKDQRW